MSETKIYHIEEIMQMLPHRYPFCWLTVWKLKFRAKRASASKTLP